MEPNPGYTETFSGTNSKMLTVAFLLVIIVGAIGLYFAMKPKIFATQVEMLKPSQTDSTPITGNVANTPSPVQAVTPNISSEGVKIDFNDIIICTSFSDDVCVENTEKKIKRGDSFYVYEEIVTTNPFQRTQVFKQSINIEDGMGEVLFEKDKYDEFIVGRGTNVTIPVKVLLYTFESDPVRKETVTLTFENEYTHERIEKKITYELI